MKTAQELRAGPELVAGLIAAALGGRQAETG